MSVVLLEERENQLSGDKSILYVTVGEITLQQAIWLIRPMARPPYPPPKTCMTAYTPSFTQQHVGLYSRMYNVQKTEIKIAASLQVNDSTSKRAKAETCTDHRRTDGREDEYLRGFVTPC